MFQGCRLCISSLAESCVVGPGKDVLRDLCRICRWLEHIRTQLPMAIRSQFFRPEDDEPTSPANALVLLTLGFVFAVFILPLLFAGVQSKNQDIAGADDAGLGGWGKLDVVKIKGDWLMSNSCVFIRFLLNTYVQREVL